MGARGKNFVALQKNIVIAWKEESVEVGVGCAIAVGESDSRVSCVEKVAANRRRRVATGARTTAHQSPFTAWQRLFVIPITK